MTWSAKQYLEFEDERTRPVRDLLAGLPSVPVRAAIDVGCGPGNSTEALAARFPAATVRGFDSSADMVTAARRRLPRIEFEVTDIREWMRRQPDESVDVILANAVLQWIPNHRALFGALAGKLRRGGCLAVQMPDNLAEPAQVAMREVATSGRWRDKLSAMSEPRVAIESPQWYYGILGAHCSRVDIWRTTYHHPLAGAAAIVEWFKGSGLRPFIDPLDEGDKADYLRSYTARIAAEYPADADGRVLLPFPRLFMVAVR